MSESSEDFFEGKRPWSIIKDEVLKSYMSPYIAKVNKRGQRILLIDGYAGPSTFGDGKPGSPVIICQAAEKFAKGNYQAIFINIDQTYHNTLTQVIHQEGWSNSVKTRLGDSTVLLQQLAASLTNQTVFLYIDPFGLKECEFALLKPFLDRNRKFSTEIVLTMQMPIVHRLATRHAVEDGRQDEQIIKSYHQRLTKVFGGEYWQDIMWQQNVSSEEREFQLIKAYQDKLTQYLAFVGSCPVRLQTDKRIKYFIVFASGHEDSMLLMNDIMVNAYFAKMHEAAYAGTLFEETDWREMRSTKGLDEAIIQTVAEYPGDTRHRIWLRIVQRHFMRYLEKEYRSAVMHLVDQKKLITPTPRKTKLLNDNCRLYLP